MFLIHSIRLFSQILSCDVFEKLGNLEKFRLSSKICSFAIQSYCLSCTRALSHANSHTEPVILALMIMTLANMHTELS